MCHPQSSWLLAWPRWFRWSRPSELTRFELSNELFNLGGDLGGC